MLDVGADALAEASAEVVLPEVPASITVTVQLVDEAGLAVFVSEVEVRGALEDVPVAVDVTLPADLPDGLYAQSVRLVEPGEPRPRLLASGSRYLELTAGVSTEVDIEEYSARVWPVLLGTNRFGAVVEEHAGVVAHPSAEEGASQSDAGSQCVRADTLTTEQVSSVSEAGER